MINKVADNKSNIEQTLLIISPIGSRNKSTKIKWIIQDGRKMEILQWWPNMRMKKEPNVVVYLNMKRIDLKECPGFAAQQLEGSIVHVTRKIICN